jgi:PAS domain S-box-containing protein
MALNKLKLAPILAPPPAADAVRFLHGAGEMTALVRAKDWSQTPLGPLDAWPQSLRTAVSLCLASNFPINLIWGPENTQIYNDGYRIICGDAHPTALGQGYDVTWASAWPAIGKPFERARGGETSFLENQRMFLTRNGYLEETFFTFSLSPIRDESGGVAGLFHPVTETTAAMLAARRMRALRDLATNLADTADFDELAAKTARTLAGVDVDLPFVLLYALTPDGRHYDLAACDGVAVGSAISPRRIARDAHSPWPIEAAARSSSMLEVGGVRALLQGAQCGPYEETPEKAFVIPIGTPTDGAPQAILVVGASPRLPLNDSYRGFIELLANSITAALAAVRAREDERRRAAALAAIDRAKTAFFSNVSHEFRTPLTLMLGPIEEALADADALPPAQRERIEMAHRNALRLLKLVNALLDFSRIESGRPQAHFEPTELGAFTTDLASNFRSACERAGLTLVVDCSPLSRPVHVDRDMWEKIVLNLMSNAFKFTLSGGIDVAQRETATGIELVVRDSGVGIPLDELPRIFERFHRIEGQKGRSFEGTGIGLSLVRELVELHGGAISAVSVEGRGAALRVTLPFGVASKSRGAVASSPPTAAAGMRSQAFVEEALRWLPDEIGVDAGAPREAMPVAGARPRVLFADDNADMRRYVRQILLPGGYEVEAVANGAAALAALTNGAPPDLVLCDVMMPELDGFGLLAAVRANPDLKGLPVIMLSARAGEEARIEGLAAGADDYLVKPFSARELKAHIDGAVGLGRQRRETAGRERAANIELELRVAERTEELRQVNARLTEAFAKEASARRALAASESQLRASFEGTAIGRTVIDPVTKKMLRANRALAEMLGREVDELIGMTGAEVTWPEDRPIDQAEYACLLSGERGAYLREKRYLRRDGTPFWVRKSAALARVSTEEGETTLVVAAIEDIDERHKAQDALRAAKLDLERLVDEKTAALKQRDLLLREVYHRVNNNLQVIDSLLMMQAREFKESPRAGEALLELRGRVHALGLVHHQLMRSADLETFDVEPFLRELSNNLLDGRDVSGVTISVEASPIAVGLDFAIPLGMLVTELVTNSLKHAFPAGAGSISVALGVEADGAVVLKVCDDGEATPRDGAPHDAPGLGASIVRGLVAQISGTMWERRENGMTTEIRTRMPVRT